MIPAPSLFPVIRPLAKFCTVALLLSAARAEFTVRSNVNDGKAPETVFTLFEKGKGMDHLNLAPKGETTEVSLTEEGQLRIAITGHAESQLTISWKAGSGIPEKLNAEDYAGLLIRYRFDGTQVNTWQGKQGPRQAVTNPWLIFMLLDSGGERTSAINPAFLEPDDALPTEMREVLIPMSVFIQDARNDLSSLSSLDFRLPGTRSTTDRDFKIVIERIAFVR